jgi:hypothetical protein
MTDRWQIKVGQLRLMEGMRQEHPKTLGITERRALLPIKSRGKGQLHVLVELSGEKFGREEMCQDLVNAITEEYFHTPGTITYGLRQAVLLANTQLVRANARVTSEHRVGGVACVVLRDGEIFVAQAGWPMVYLVHQERVEAYPDTPLDIEDTSMLGQRQTTEVRLFRAHVQPGDMVLMVDGPMARQLGTTRIGQILSGSVSRAMSNLETLAPPEDCTAMVIQIGSPEAQPRAQKEQWAFMPIERPSPLEEEPTRVAATPIRPRAEQPRAPSTVQVAPRPKQRRTTPPTQTTHKPEQFRTPQTPTREAEPVTTRMSAAREPPPPRRQASPTIGQRTRTLWATIAQGARTLGERMLPDKAPRSASHRRRRTTRTQRTRGQAVGQPNLGIAAALAIPVLALIIVGAYMTYRNWSNQSQFDAKLDEAKLKRDVALGSSESPTVARDYWREVIALASDANAIQPDDPDVLQLLEQAATEIDRIDGVTRLGQAFKLYDYTTPGSAPARTIVAGLDVYVLDRGTGRVYHHALNEQRNAIRDPEADQVLIQEAQPIEGQTVGVLVDIAWMKDGGERQAGALLILDRNGLMIEYDPSWEQLHIESLGGKDVWRNPVALKTFDSNLYILDNMANQVFKYPEQQFSAAPVHWIQGEVDTASAIDIGIDGSIYLLHNNGRIAQFYAGESVPFTITRTPTPLVSANALYMDTPEVAQYVYVADASEMRIVQLDREGVFVRQLRPLAELETSFRQLNGLFVDETGGKLYYTTSSALYVTDLPPVQR